MGKTILKEIIICLILIAAILLILTVLFYDSIPMNKVVPTKVTYTLPENLQSELDKTLEAEQEVIITYTIDEKDLGVYEKTNSYNPGKIDPFSTYEGSSNNAGNTNENGTTGNTNTNQNNSTGGGSSGNTTNK